MLEGVGEGIAVEWLSVEGGKPLRWDLCVRDGRIELMPDRKGNTPPYLMPLVDLSQEALRGYVALRVGDYAGAMEWLGGHEELLPHVVAYGAIAMVTAIDVEVYEQVARAEAYDRDGVYYAAHNAAILRHYLMWEDEQARQEADVLFRRALEHAPQRSMYAFTLRQYAAFLTDAGAADRAEQILRALEGEDLDELGQYDLHHALLQVRMAQLVAPYDDFLIGEIKSLLRTCLAWEEQLGNTVRQGMLLTDAAHVALLIDHYSEALSYINRALKIFQSEGIEEFYAEALRKKGEILYSWAQSGQSQFYKPALECYKEALKYFPKDRAPYAYADIQHHLGIIYAEMPVEEKKRGIMAGLSMAAFHEALEVFTPSDFPYEYAAVCTHMGNALCRFPQPLHSDNYKKALEYYEKALAIRTEAMPMERALTLLNYLEAFWHMRPENGSMDRRRWEDLRSKAEEILQLVDDEHLCEEARRHLRQLEQWQSINS